MRIQKLFVIAATALVCCASGCQHKTQPLGQEQVQELDGLSADQTTAFPLLNVYTDNPALGDERNFVRIAPFSDSNATNIGNFQTEKFTLKTDESYSVMVYCHNAADVSLGESASADCVVLTLSYPETLQKGETDAIYAGIAYGKKGDLGTGMVTNQLEITAEDNLHLQPGIFLEGAEPEYHAMLCDNYGENWATCNPTIKSDHGTVVYIFALDDIAPGYDGAGFIFLKIDAVAE